MKWCKYCNKQLRHEFTFCPYCSAKLSEKEVYSYPLRELFTEYLFSYDLEKFTEEQEENLLGYASHKRLEITFDGNRVYSIGIVTK